MKEDRKYYESKDDNSDYINFEFTLVPYEALQIVIASIMTNWPSNNLL